MKRFTKAEAETLIPRLEEIFGVVSELAVAGARKSRRIEELAASGAPAELALARSQLEFLGHQVAAQLEKIAALGAVPKGLEPALVDFPARLEGRDVYLCWKLGEKRITAYHGTDEGFAGRKKLREA